MIGATSPAMRRNAGFTLIEAIVAMVITGILAGMVAVFIKTPVDSYVSSARRADLTDVADTAVRRIGRDIRLALPNSVRNPSTGGAGQDQCIEFMPTRIGGRYRAAQTDDATPAGDILDFTLTPPDDKFDMLWLNSALPTTAQIRAGDIVVVYNDGSPLSGDAYTGRNAIRISGAPTEPGGTAGTTEIAFVTNAAAGAPFQRKQLPAESPSYRFQVIPNNEQVVAYACSGVGTVGGNGTGVLTRYSRTLSAAWSPTTCAEMVANSQAAPATLASSVLAENLAACSLRYEPPGSGSGAGRFGIVSISLEIKKSDESVPLYHQVHVDNTP